MKKYIKSDKFLRPDSHIQRVSADKLDEVLDSAEKEEDYRPLGYFYAYSNGVWVAIDNSNGCAWTEEFSTEEQAIAWLNGEFEVGEEEAYDDGYDGSFF